MKLDSMYPVLLTDDVAGCSGLFVEHMGFEERLRSDWYVSLVHGGNGAYELAIISHGHETIPGDFRRPAGALLLNFEVPDVHSEHDRLTAEGGRDLAVNARPSGRTAALYLPRPGRRDGRCDRGGHPF